MSFYIRLMVSHLMSKELELIREALRSYMRKSYIRNTQKADDDAKILENMLG